MSIENHTREFIAALYGDRGDLDAWLEFNNEAECRLAIIGAIMIDREECANEIERKSKEIYSVLLCEHEEAANWLRELAVSKDC